MLPGASLLLLRDRSVLKAPFTVSSSRALAAALRKRLV